MISIVTSIYNQLGMNKLFVETLRKNTYHKFELIIIDNDSTDGSKEFFRENSDVLIENGDNYSYPYCQNKGVEVAKYDYIAFFNNDILVTKDWDKHIIEIMKENNLEAITPATNDAMESSRVQRRVNNRWKRVKYPIRFLFGTRYNALKAMAWFSYGFGKLEQFAAKRYQQFGMTVKEGFSGSCVILTKGIVEKLGIWDERIQSADFDCYCTIKERSLKQGDVKPMCIALGVYVHHYQRLTLRGKYKPFVDIDNIISLNEKWQGREEELLSHIKN